VKVNIFLLKDMIRLVVCFAFCLTLLEAVLAASRTSPPSGAIVVRAGTTTSGEFSTLSSAVNSLPNDSSSRSIFIYPGTYNEQVFITRSGPLTVSWFNQYGSADKTKGPCALDLRIYD
jgi:pectinesterase